MKMLGVLAFVGAASIASCSRSPSPEPTDAKSDRPDLPVECRQLDHRSRWHRGHAVENYEVVSDAAVSLASEEDLEIRVDPIAADTEEVQLTVTNRGVEPIWLDCLFGRPIVTRWDESSVGWTADSGSIPAQCFTGAGFERLSPGASRRTSVYLSRGPHYMGVAGTRLTALVKGRVRFGVVARDHESHEGCMAGTGGELFTEVVDLHR